MTKEKTLVFDATVRDVFNLTLKQIPNLRPLLDEMGKLTPANRRSYKALLHVVATEHNLRTAGKPGEQQKLALPEPEKPPVRTPSKAENWATFTREFSEEILKADKNNPEPWYVPTVIWRHSLLGLLVGVQTRDGEVNTFGSQVACKTQLLYLTQHGKDKSWVEVKAALPSTRTKFWDEELLPLYGGGPVNQPDRPRDEYEDNQWILLRPEQVAHPMYFRTVVHATKLDQDLLELSRYWRIDRLTLTSIQAHEYLVECAHYMETDALRDLANKLKLEMPKKETAR